MEVLMVSKFPFVLISGSGIKDYSTMSFSVVVLAAQPVMIYEVEMEARVQCNVLQRDQQLCQRSESLEVRIWNVSSMDIDMVR